MQERVEDMMRQDVEDKIEAADERITHQIARRLEQEEKKRKAADDVVNNSEDVMQDSKDEKERNESMPMKKAKAQEPEDERGHETEDLGAGIRTTDVPAEEMSWSISRGSIRSGCSHGGGAAPG